MREQFTFRSEYFNEIKQFKRKADKLKMFEAICDYSLSHIEPSGLSAKQQASFEKIRQQMDLDWRSASEIRRSGEYKDWRNAVFRRDNYTCQRCGARSVQINAHHIKPFAQFPDLRTELSNGVTLCVACHKAVHHGT